eukprot:2512978-Rhodomonas_salina.2
MICRRCCHRCSRRCRRICQPECRTAVWPGGATIGSLCQTVAAGALGWRHKAGASLARAMSHCGLQSA